MEPLRFTEQFKKLVETAANISDDLEASAIILFVHAAVDWARLRKLLGERNVIVAAYNVRTLDGASENGFHTVTITYVNDTTVSERIDDVILEAVADDFMPPGTRVVVIYSGFDPNIHDSVSVINLVEHLDRLSGRYLRELEAKVPLPTLKIVIELAIEIGNEGREDKNVGTLFVVGDTHKVLAQSKPAGFDPVRGYPRSERSLRDAKVREGIKEVAQLDGAFVVSADGTVVAACRILETSGAQITLSKGLGSRHWAAAAISRTTSAIAIAVSQSSGTVRVFQNGECALRVEARHRKPMVWKANDADGEQQTSEKK
ncbi:MAG: diadenylate cyclase [Planctomycetaceae bacterium]|nr:diadenylate cyclase [Planctomycetaceae bacterium]